MTRLEAWLTGRRYRLAHRRAELSGVRPGGVTERVAGRWQNLTVRSRARWHRAADRLTGRWRPVGRRPARFRWLTYRVGVRWAEWRARRRSRERPSSAPAMIVLGVSLAIASGVIALDRNAQEAPRSTEAASEGAPVARAPSAAAPPQTSASVDQLPGVDVHVNDRAGYLFSYPDSWQLTPSGENTDLLSPDGNIQMTFGTAPTGSLRQASDSVVRGFTSPYTDAKVLARDLERTEQGQPSLVVGGTATDGAEGSISFLVITIRGQDRSWAITVRFSGDSKPLAALPAIREIIASFRTSQVVV